MLFSSFGLLAAASSLLSLTSAHNIQMKAHQRECFHEQLHKDDKMTVTFQVGDREFGGSGNLEIDFWVRNGSAPPSNLTWEWQQLIQMSRSKHHLAATRSTSAAYPPATILSTQRKTANTHTASTTSTGAQIQRRSRSTCTALSMSLSRRRHKIPWRRRVRNNNSFLRMRSLTY